jgi:hypothetical protein
MRKRSWGIRIYSCCWLRIGLDCCRENSLQEGNGGWESEADGERSCLIWILSEASRIRDLLA